MLAAHNDLIEGTPGSPVHVQIYEDLQCGDCARFETLLEDRLLPKYGRKVVFIHRDFPLGKHEWARDAAIASRWVYEQDPELGITFRRELMSEQNSINLQNLKQWMAEFAIRNRLDPKAIVQSLNDPRFCATVDQDLMTGTARGITKTPTVIVGGKTFVETVLYDDVASVLNEALK
jgi:protein-disulfide isomerase